MRFAWAARLGWWPRAVLLCAVPTAVMPLPYPTPVHAVEAALLVNALASQAGGRFAAALVMVTLAVLVKPGLGAVYGLVLVALVLGGCAGGGSWRARLKLFAPAAVVGGGIAVALGLWFGWGPLAETLLPVRAAQNYGDEKFGFFGGDGRRFWLPDAVHPFHYLFTPAGVWLAATALLVAGAVRRARRLADPVAGSVVACAVLHAVFVLFLFGNQWSWLYYSALLACGLAAVIGDGAATAPRRVWVVPLAVAALAVLGQVAPLAFVAQHWAAWERSPATAGLYALPADAAAWEGVRARGRTDRVMVFANTGGAFVVFPELDGPRVWFLLRSTATPGEIERVRGQIRAANWLVLPHAGRPLYPEWPEFAADLAAFEPAGESPSFQLERRVGR